LFTQHLHQLRERGANHHVPALLEASVNRLEVRVRLRKQVLLSTPD
jgi:hypothetical protein